MDNFNQNDFIEFQRRNPPPPPPRNPPPPPPRNPPPPPPRNPLSPPPFPGDGRPSPGFGPGPGGPPRSGPPNYIPSRQIAPLRVDSASIRNCMRSFTYIWLRNGDEFWMFPIQLSRNSISGFRWNRFGWSFFGVSLNQIDAFMCV